MKKLLTIALCFFLFCFQQVKAQENIAKFQPTGMLYNSGDNWNANYMMKFGFERVFTNKVSGQFNLGFAFLRTTYRGYFVATRTFKKTMVLLEPEFRYYILDNAPKSLYLGGFYKLGFYNGLGGAFMAIGPQVGYQYLLLNDRLALDGSLGMGASFYAGIGNALAGFHLQFAVGAGYAF